MPSSAQQKDKSDPQIRQLLAAHQKIYDEAMNSGDAATLANKMFTEDAVLVTDTGPIYGRAAIEKHFADMFKQAFAGVIRSLRECVERTFESCRRF